MSALVPFNRNDLSTGHFFNMLDDFFSDAFAPVRSLMNDTFKVDVKEKKNAYIVEAEMPGVQKDEIALNLAAGRLTIRVTRDEQINSDEDNFIHRERRCASMQRSIYLENASDADVKAELKNGVLKIEVPKTKDAANGSRIEIR